MTAETIARGLGLRRAGAGRWHGQCPSCGYRTGFAVTERRSGLPLVYCHAGGCPQADVIQALRKAGLWPQQQPERDLATRQRRRATQAAEQPATAQPDECAKEKAVLAIWRRSRPIIGTVGEVYLRFRGYTGPIPPALRFASGKHPSDGQFYPMMVAAVVLEGRMDQAIAIHRTFLRADGRGKVEFQPDKMTLGPCKGGAVPLAPAGPVLAVGEGIESALSYMLLTDIPTWSALSASGIQNLILPTLVEEVVIATDPDITGIRAAREAARRWLAEGRRVSIARPPAGCDFNDLLRAA
jgi:putative DNA primase/helicase